MKALWPQDNDACFAYSTKDTPLTTLLYDAGRKEEAKEIAEMKKV